MKSKLLNVLLIISSLFGYLEWGQNKKIFLFQIEAELFSKIFKDPLAVIHPIVFLPLIGQIILIITLFQKLPGKILTYIGVAGLGILMALVFLVGCINLNFAILFSTIPFLVLGYFTIRYQMKGAMRRSSLPVE